jgi:cysteinyl-tRNA synthetase
MDDDLNTPSAIAAFQGLKSAVNKLLSQGLSTGARNKAREAFRDFGERLGLFQLEKWSFGPVVAQVMEADIAMPITPGKSRTIGQVKETNEALPISVKKSGIDDSKIEDLLRERNEARAKKDFKQADEIRKSLSAQGIIIEDKPDGTTRWKR